MRDGMASALRPVIFIPGLWMHAESWTEWAGLFRERGYDPILKSWPGVPPTIAEARAHPETMADRGIAEIAGRYAEIVHSLEVKPVLVGHSFGGLIAQALLGRDLATAAIAIDPAPIKGVLRIPLATLRSAFPVLRNPANAHRAVPLTPGQFRYGFANAVSRDEAGILYERWAIPGPGRPLFQAAFARFAPHSEAAVDTANPTRGPLLLVAGEKDHIAPPAVTRATLRLYGDSPAVTDFQEFPGRGHSLVVDHGWREVALASLAWLSVRASDPFRGNPS
jgi:pimeloyl-ACP methyl ester carboxylesterase